MLVLTKRMRPRLIMLVLFLPAIFLVAELCWRTIGRASDQESNQQQPNQRPRRVTGTEQSSDNKTSATPTTQEVDEGDVVRVDTQLVSVPTVVTDSSGHPVAGLRPENFLILEDGRPQEVASFGTTETPFEIALLLDTSGSTRDDVALIRQAANSFIEALRPGDRVGIVAFNAVGPSQMFTVVVLTPLTGDRKSL